MDIEIIGRSSHSSYLDCQVFRLKMIAENKDAEIEFIMPENDSSFTREFLSIIKQSLIVLAENVLPPIVSKKELAFDIQQAKKRLKEMEEKYEGMK